MSRSPRPSRPRRPGDRLRAVVAGVLRLAAVVALAVSVLTGLDVHDRLLRPSAAPVAARSAPGAAAVERVPPQAVPPGWATVTSYGVDGIVLAVPPGAAARLGGARPAGAPTTPLLAAVAGALAGAVLFCAAAAVLAAVWVLTRRVTAAMVLRAWEREWRAVEPLWSGRGR